MPWERTQWVGNVVRKCCICVWVCVRERQWVNREGYTENLHDASSYSLAYSFPMSGQICPEYHRRFESYLKVNESSEIFCVQMHSLDKSIKPYASQKKENSKLVKPQQEGSKGKLAPAFRCVHYSYVKRANLLTSSEKEMQNPRAVCVW